MDPPLGAPKAPLHAAARVCFITAAPTSSRQQKLCSTQRSGHRPSMVIGDAFLIPLFSFPSGHTGSKYGSQVLYEIGGRRSRPNTRFATVHFVT